MARTQLAFALDYPSLDAALPVLERVQPHVGVAKVGLELYLREGRVAVQRVRDMGFDVFLDLKLCDIPETIHRAILNLRTLGVRYLTVHASGGPEMLRRAQEAAGSELTLLGVTVLTSLDAGDLRAIGVSEPDSQALRLAKLSREAGVKGLVCSAHEARALREALGPTVVLVTPGIRSSSDKPTDQKRVATPTEAIRAGASLLVVGRPIRDAQDPVAAARAIANEIETASHGG